MKKAALTITASLLLVVYMTKAQDCSSSFFLSKEKY